MDHLSSLAVIVPLAFALGWVWPRRNSFRKPERTRTPKLNAVVSTAARMRALNVQDSKGSKSV